jgi:hypothetical protein
MMLMSYLHRATEDCRFRLLCIVEIRRLRLPTPDLELPTPSSLAGGCTRCGRGRPRVGVGRFCCATPAVNCISSRKLSRSEANLRSAFSKSCSLRPDPPTNGTPLIVVLLRLLAECFASAPMTVPTEVRCSLRRPERRLQLSPRLGRPSCDVGRIESVSRARSSSWSRRQAGRRAGKSRCCCRLAVRARHRPATTQCPR